MPKTECEFCQNGWFDPSKRPYFGQDVECINGVLMDIDEFTEGHDPSTVRMVAPCHPDYGHQLLDSDFIPDQSDVDRRLAERRTT